MTYSILLSSTYIQIQIVQKFPTCSDESNYRIYSLWLPIFLEQSACGAYCCNFWHLGTLSTPHKLISSEPSTHTATSPL